MKERLEACSHYCERRKGKLFFPHVTENAEPLGPGKKIKELIKGNPAGAIIWKMAKEMVGSSIIFHDRYSFNNNLGIFLTTVCNLSCNNCQTSARQAPANDTMSIGQIRKLVDDAIRLEYYWNIVYLTGGEASLHPQLFEIFNELKRYKNFNPDCRIIMETNGVGPKVQSVLPRVPAWIEVESSNKTEGMNYDFYEYNRAPADSWLALFADFSNGCSRLKYCFGLSATMYGFYPCSPCVNVARVFGLDIGIKELGDVTEKALRKQLKMLCRYCGWFREPLHGTTLEQTMSPSWKRAFAAFRQQKPKMSRFE